MRPIIPFCRSERLQDFTIELGREYFRDRGFGGQSFLAEVDVVNHNDEDLERLCVWLDGYYGTSATLCLWEDGTVWISISIAPAENSQRYSLGFYPKCQGFTPKAMVDAFRDTFSLSTKLCYSEVPVITLRKIWQHKGTFKSEGTLRKTETKNQ